ncbi:hypothetical protein EDD85DRAFT_947417 [Armillaria nabsnona]|nr:hypothetical protein EDD85DRAFT_947417 [Armillaria nabsnona]
MNSTSSTGQPTAIVSTPNADKLNWIDWLCLNYPTHSRQEIQEFYLSRFGSDLLLTGTAATLSSLQAAVSRLHPALDESMQAIDINVKDHKHQIGFWQGELADDRQYQFTFINSDGRPIPVPHGVYIYGVPRTDGGGSEDELPSLERTAARNGDMDAADIKSEVFVAPEGAIYCVTGLGDDVHFAVPVHDDFVLASMRPFTRATVPSYILDI